MTERRRPDAALVEAQWEAQMRAHRMAAPRPLDEKIATLPAMQPPVAPRAEAPASATGVGTALGDRAVIGGRVLREGRTPDIDSVRQDLVRRSR